MPSSAFSTAACSIGPGSTTGHHREHGCRQSISGSDITKLIGPIVSGHADIVVGARPIADIEHVSAVKKSLQRWGSGAIKWLTGADVTDATSGFRAISRDAALRLFTPFTYTLETIIQGARSGMKIVSVRSASDRRRGHRDSSARFGSISDVHCATSWALGLFRSLWPRLRGIIAHA